MKPKKVKQPPAYQTILRLFFKPLIHKVLIREDLNDPCQAPFVERLSTLMSAQERGIDLFQSSCNFILPGAKLIRPNRPDRRAFDPKERKILKGYKFMVRLDRSIDFVDVQYYKNRWDKAGDERVFRLTAPEWDVIKDKLTPIKG